MPNGPQRPAVFTIPSHRSFADSLVAGLIGRFGRDPLELARGRILVPNNRAVRSITEAFVRASGGGLLLPRLIPIGDPELDERIGGAIDTIADPVPQALDATQRQLLLSMLVREPGESAAETFRLAGEIGRTIDALEVEEIDPAALRKAVSETDELAAHWERSLVRFQAALERWQGMAEGRSLIDLAHRRNLLLCRLANRWKDDPPTGFTVAAGVTTAAPAVAALLGRVARIPDGMVVLPGLSLSDAMPDEEWEALGPDENKRGEHGHPQYHLKQLLDRMSVARGEVERWRRAGRAASPSARTRVIANAMAAPEYSHKWEHLTAPQRRLTGVRLAELPDPAAEAQAIALALRETLETPEKTAALVTPDRQLAGRVSALLGRWGIVADDSAGTPLSRTAAGTLLLSIAAAAAEDFAPVPLLALLKHPLVGGEEQQRAEWLDAVRHLDLILRGPRPPAGLAALDSYFAEKKCLPSWENVRPRLEPIASELTQVRTAAGLAAGLATAVEALASDAAWRGPDGRMAAELLLELQASRAAEDVSLDQTDLVPLLRQLLDARSVRPPYGGHPRISIWGLLEARLQHADLMILGGLNEGTWPSAPAPDPWLPPKVRATLGMPGLEFRIGLAAHDFASALGAPEVLITRARRDSRSPTIASRFLLRLQAMTGGLARDLKLERLTAALDNPGSFDPVGRPAPKPPIEQRPTRISVTAVDRLKADPFAFYARAILRLYELEPVDSDHTARWKGTAVHEVFEDWLRHDDCDPAKLRVRAEQLLAADAIHPMLRALWAPRLLEAIDWIAELERSNREQGRRPLAAEASGKAEIAGVIVEGRVDRIDRLSNGGIAIIDYKTGKPPSKKALENGFALQLGLLGLIARAGGFEDVPPRPEAFEYWSLIKDRDHFGKCVKADKEVGPAQFLATAEEMFSKAAAAYLTGTDAFTAKLNPAYAPYTEYDQLMRLEEWYGRS